MAEAVELFVKIVIILVAAKLMGEVFHRFKQPALVGEILAGIILGPSLFGLIEPTQDLEVLSNIAVFFLMLLTGLEMDKAEIAKAGKSAVVIACLAFSLPFLLGYAASALLGLGTIEALFMALLISLTAVPVSAMVLMEFGALRSRLGNTVITTAVINDIASMIVLSLILQIGVGGEGTVDAVAVAISIGKVSLFIGGIFLVDLALRRTGKLLPRKVGPYIRSLRTREASFALLMIGTITISIAAEEMGLHFIIGTFFSGLLIYKELIGEHYDRVVGIISCIVFGFFAPIFFVVIGTEFNLGSVMGQLVLLGILLVVASVGKIAGGVIGGHLVGFGSDERMALGTLLNGRGMVELVIASIGLSMGLIDTSLFSIGVAIGVITTIITPITAKRYMARLDFHGVPTKEP